VHVLVSLLVAPSFALTAFGDLTQCALLLLGTLFILSNVTTRDKKSQRFWALMALGCGMWLSAQVMWTYFEVFLRQETPNPFVGDVVLFLHIVPMMAALAVQPHVQRDDHALPLVSLDFVLLLTWWLYLYLFIVIPWQYVSPNEAVYGRSFDLLYACEQFVFIVGLALVWARSCGPWRKVYAHFVGAATLYSVGSILAGLAIDSHSYHTGSLYDVPLVAAMAWFAGVGFMASRALPEHSGPKALTYNYNMWTARLAMLAVFSTPLMVAWAQFGGAAPDRVRTYRLILTVAAMVFMGTLVFLKQQFMDRELLYLLRLSRQNLDETCQLKDELESKEQSLRWHSLELQRKNLELQEISFTDPLTRVWNRRYLEEILTAEAGQVLRNYERAHSSGDRGVDHGDLIFLMVDVDFFKDVNDLHGHPAGDRLLQKVAERLSTVVRKSDVLVRWGGEEFLIMSRSADPAGTPAFCQRILEVMSQPFDLGHGINVRKTCSVGRAPFPWCRDAYEAVCAEEGIELADTALYRAKAWGRNQGVGILPSRGAVAAPQSITLENLQTDGRDLTRVVKTPNLTGDGAAYSLTQELAGIDQPQPDSSPKLVK